jgi:hypothetical protein
MVELGDAIDNAASHLASHVSGREKRIVEFRTGGTYETNILTWLARAIPLSPPIEKFLFG